MKKNSKEYKPHNASNLLNALPYLLIAVAIILFKLYIV